MVILNWNKRGKKDKIINLNVLTHIALIASLHIIPNKAMCNTQPFTPNVKNT